MLTISKENYLKTIYHKKRLDGKPVSASSIAEELNISNAAISEMAKKLSSEGLLDYTKYKGMVLTNKGEQQALKVVRKHRLWELFLIDVLGLSWSEVHDEAEKLEHQTSEYLIDKIDEYLNFPEFDPHGDPIPNKNGKLPEVPERLLLHLCEVGKTYLISRVDDRNSQLVNYLSRIGLNLNKEIHILEKMEFDNSIKVSVESDEILLTEKVVNSISVSLKNDNL
ncbi:MAG: metal-dependent transcriptional regulator [Bacteroidetes bacterium]|nr:metal-dependent transcriptional regulator [Bacteroidota bacterium]